MDFKKYSSKIFGMRTMLTLMKRICMDFFYQRNLIFLKKSVSSVFPSHHLIYLLFFITIFPSCEKSTTWELNNNTPPKLVIEAILTDENRNQEIRLSQSFSELNGDAPKVSDAVVTVEANGVVYNFVEDADESGLYKSVTSFKVIDNLIYNLNILWDGKNYSATSELSEVAPIPSIIFSPFGNNDSLLVFGNFVPILNANQQAMYELEIDWSHLSNELPNRAKTYLYTFTSVHINELVRPKAEPVPFPKGSLVHIKKFGLNDDFANYLRSKLIETDWNGTFFYSTPENLPTNIDNDGLGFFSTCAVLSDVVIAE